MYVSYLAAASINNDAVDVHQNGRSILGGQSNGRLASLFMMCAPSEKGAVSFTKDWVTRELDCFAQQKFTEDDAVLCCW